MRTVAVVPVKALSDSKSRLATVLTPDQRAALTLRLLRGALDALDGPGIVARLVVSPDPAVLAVATAAGAAALEQRGGGLNEALEGARRWAEGAAADALLIVLGDLPLLTPADTAAIVALAQSDGVADRATVVLAPDRHETGTNALLLRPAGAMPFAFGRDSLARHRAAAAARALVVHHYRAPGTALDLDTPDDLDELRANRR